MSWHGVNVELNIREATALEGHSREAIHLAAEVIADVTGYSRVTEWTWAKVEAAAAATAGWRRTRRGEWRGPCRCGGEVNRAWVRRGRRANVLAGCNAGCSGPDVIAWLTGDELARPGRAFPPRRNEWPRPRPGWAVRRPRGR